ncbi:hypothetical protein ARMGADRAFT_1033040 [Armillaria gallica]|uniref:Uncharacterized protein n=1 Tax=Armillaria gallica TaxID=47427 RepID=A0A2H3D2F1_ARMGA|nr:hypothetical protein ARMGADRAFT_1033040 [Armillaria gallica]
MDMPADSMVVIDDHSPTHTHSANLQRKRSMDGDIIEISSDEEDVAMRRKNRKISSLEGMVTCLKQEMTTARQDQRSMVKKLKQVGVSSNLKQVQHAAEELVMTFEEWLGEIREDTVRQIAQDKA